MPKSKSNLTKSYIELSKTALENNLNTFRKIVGRKKIYCVVKANAYGHGLAEIIGMLETMGADMYAVDSIEEAIKIRDWGVIKPVLILGYIRRQDILEAIENDISFTIYNNDILKVSDKIKSARKAKVHIKIETGLNRQGLKTADALNLAKIVENNKDRFLLEGISTHFTDIEDTIDPSYSRYQLKQFIDFIKQLEKIGIYSKIRHCACSAAAILYPDTHFDAVRAGISLYGLWSSKETMLSSRQFKNRFVLRPVLTWKSIVAQVKEISKGESVGYGRTWYSARKSKIAVIPVGYSDGLDRGLSNNGRVIVKGSYAPIIGRIAMNMTMIDVTDIENVKCEDEVILIGKENDKNISVDEIAQKIGTINYEIVSRINPNLTRIIKE